MRTAHSRILVTLVMLSLPLACSSVREPPITEDEARAEENVSSAREALIICQTPLGDIAVCPNTSGCCNGACTDLQFNNTSCGACGNTCGLFKGCTYGHCCNVGTVWCPAMNACAAPCDCTPDLSTWLESHPRVANAIRWQVTNTGPDAYIPLERDKQLWASWPVQRKAALIARFTERYTALCGGKAPPEIADPVQNIDTGIANDGGQSWVSITARDAESMYIAEVAHSLAIELGGFVPWSVTGYDDESLAVLFDSGTMMSRLFPPVSTYMLGDWFSAVIAPTRAGNRGRVVPAAPSRTYAFMKAGLVGSTRHATIVNLMQWGHDNLVHFIDGDTFLNHEQTWGYRGHAPVSRMISGTTSTNPHIPATLAPFEHWTAGCHGTAGFMRDTLRAVNIPVVIPHACGHSQLYFPTEGLYVDHGDNLYTHRMFPFTMEQILIDQATYTAWFGDNLHNEDWTEKLPAVHCQNLERGVDQWAP